MRLSSEMLEEVSDGDISCPSPGITARSHLKTELVKPPISRPSSLIKQLKMKPLKFIAEKEFGMKRAVTCVK